MKKDKEIFVHDNIFIPESCDGAQIIHDKDFFVIDFWTKFPSGCEEPRIEPFIRIKMNPETFEKIIDAMRENLKKYKNKYKNIQ